MEKLLELVMQHEKEVKTPRFPNVLPKNIILTKDKKHIRIWGQGYEYFEAYLISKEYGFIKWLVENDKIDTNNLSLKSFKNIFSGGGFVEVSDLEVLLMLLSISDTPIKDLISYLK